MKLTGLKDDYAFLSKSVKGLHVYIGKKSNNILIFHAIEEKRKIEELMALIGEEEKGYLVDKLNHQQELVVYIRKLPLMRSCYTLFYQTFDDVFDFILHSMHEELLEYVRQKEGDNHFKCMVVKDRLMKEVPYF